MRRVKSMNSASGKQAAHLQLALEQSAMHIVDVALTRWTSGNTYAEWQLVQALRPTRQARWHETVQLNFKAWLAAGGFAASPDAKPSDASPVLAGSGAKHGATTLPARSTPVCLDYQ